jgi:hypothetical protein
MPRRISCLLLLAAALCFSAAPTPKEYFGFTPGDDYKLANYSEIIGYFKKLEASSGRIRLAEFGKTSNGKPMYVAFLSAPENLKKLDRYREISRKLALGQVEPAEARRLAEEGKAIVWIDSGLHASEVAPAQHAPVLAYDMVAGETEEIRRILQNVILLQVPAINPDGLDMVAEWYRQNVGTPYQLAKMPWLYQKYAGHDNNRDWFMMNLAETRNVTRLLFQEWFPQIVYNQHQAQNLSARIFVPPYAEPVNPNIPAAVVLGINGVGAAISERFSQEGKPGVLSHTQFDGWWNGGLRSVPAFHNMLGILTETALYSYATPYVYAAPSLPSPFKPGNPAVEPASFSPRPSEGGRWGVREAIDYMLTADFAILNLAASQRSAFLLNAYQTARAQIDAGRKGGPFAYVIPSQQWDQSSVLEFLRRLKMAGIDIRKARAAFAAGGKSYPEGTYVLPVAQPFRGYLMDLLEPQKYPVLGASQRPYDITGWTLSLQMGVKVDRVDKPFEAKLGDAVEIPSAAPTLDHRQNASFLATADLLARGESVRWAADGKILTVRSASVEAFTKAAYDLKRPRVAIYQPWTANADEGWTEWLLDNYKIPYKLLHNDDFQKGGLRESFDTIILAQQSEASILHGVRGVDPADGLNAGPRPRQRPEYTGGIGVHGVAELETFVRDGGTLIALDAATDLPVQLFPSSLRTLLHPSADSPEAITAEQEASPFHCPGSLLRVTVDNSQPIAFGMPKEAIAFSTGGQAFEVPPDEGVQAVAHYAETDLLASGWISGEDAVLGKAALVEERYEKGRVILFGFRPQFRGQPFGTFKLLLNAIYLGSAKPLASARPPAEGIAFHRRKASAPAGRLGFAATARF